MSSHTKKASSGVRGLSYPYRFSRKRHHIYNWKIHKESTIISIHDSYLEAAETDLKAARTTLKEGLFSQTLYLLGQSLEKSAKSLYAYFLLNHDHLSNDKIYVRIKQLGHENWNTLPQIYIKSYVTDCITPICKMSVILLP
jgi:hypothetical protein